MRWLEHIDISGPLTDETMPFMQRRDTIVARLHASRWYAGYARDHARGLRLADQLVELVAELAAARDAETFDEWWEQIYDLADQDRVWLSPVAPPPPSAAAHRAPA